MTGRRDPDDLIRYLEDGPNELPSFSYDAVRSEIDHKRQRVVIGPWRAPNMSNVARYSIAAVAVIAIALGGYGLWTNRGGIAGPGLSPTQTPGQSALASNELSPSAPTTESMAPSHAPPSSTPAATPITLGMNETALSAGRYVASLPFPIPVTFTVPAGWTGKVAGPYAVFLTRDDIEISFTLSQMLYQDPCHLDSGFVEPSGLTTIDDMARAFASMPGIEATESTSRPLNGHPGKVLTLTAPTTIAGCTEPRYVIWRLPLGATFEMEPNDKSRIWLVNVDGQRLEIDSPEVPVENAELQAEVQGILDSLQIEP